VHFSNRQGSQGVQAELYTVAKHFLWSFRQLDLLCAGEAETKLRGPAQVEEEA